MRDAGCAVLVVSVELDEILSLADRILVMFAGRIVGEVPAGARRRAHARPDDGQCGRARRHEAPHERGRVACRAGSISALLPLVNLALGVAHRRPDRAASIGVDPLARAAHPGRAARSARPSAIGYTLYYATNFIFTGLAVAVAFHAGLFNIGGEGQAYIGGLGCGAGDPGARSRTCRRRC